MNFIKSGPLRTHTFKTFYVTKWDTHVKRSILHSYGKALVQSFELWVELVTFQWNNIFFFLKKWLTGTLVVKSWQTLSLKKNEQSKPVTSGKTTDRAWCQWQNLSVGAKIRILKNLYLLLRSLAFPQHFKILLIRLVVILVDMIFFILYNGICQHPGDLQKSEKRSLFSKGSSMMLENWGWVKRLTESPCQI